MRAAVIAALAGALALPGSLGAQDSAGIRADARVIDVHLHALPAEFGGPPPRSICAPFRRFPAREPTRVWGEEIHEHLAGGACGRSLLAPTTTKEIMERTLDELERLDVVAVTSGPLELVAAYDEHAPDRILRGLIFDLGPDAVSPDSLRRLHAAGALDVLGEVITQYSGIAPDDPRLEPYWALAEELDIPLAIHIGPGPPGAPYLAWPGFRAALSDPRTLEPVLVRHPKLRVWVMHAAWPMIDEMLAMLYVHPQLHVDVGIIDYMLPRAEFHRYLRRLVEAGFGDRVMFGSDQMIWPDAIEIAIESIESADFLTDDQKRAILRDNAARFLRLD